MARHLCFRQITKWAHASLVLAWLGLFGPLGIPAARSQSAASVGMCEFTAQGKYYVSAIFDPANGNDRSKWEIAWFNYIHDHVDPLPGNSYCRLYPSRAGAQQTLRIQRNQLGAAKIIETGWAYTSPDP